MQPSQYSADHPPCIIICCEVGCCPRMTLSAPVGRTCSVPSMPLAQSAAVESMNMNCNDTIALMVISGVTRNSAAPSRALPPLSHPSIPLPIPPYPSRPSLPFLPLPIPNPFLPLPALLAPSPLKRLEGLGERYSSHSGSGQSPAAKRIFVLFTAQNLQTC